MAKNLLGMTALGLILALGACSGGGSNGSTTTGGTDTAAATTGDGGDVVLAHDAAAGKLYALPGPRTCSTKKVPTSGAPSADVVAKYVICGAEGKFGENMYVLDKVEISGVAPGRPYNPNEDINVADIDINKPLYAIRGSEVGYQCGAVVQPGGYDGGPEDHPGTNCNRTTYPNASGLCYQDTFGDWSCKMTDANAEVNSERLVAPPAD